MNNEEIKKELLKSIDSNKKNIFKSYEINEKEFEHLIPIMVGENLIGIDRTDKTNTIENDIDSDVNIEENSHEVKISKELYDKEVFVTYSWDSHTHQEKVMQFVNFLRKKGYAADMDISLSQEETAMDFNIMMHNGLLNYKKVVVVLSKEYKRKAEKFEGGVGKEYRIIIDEILKNKNKYILVSFQDFDSKSLEEILPLWLKGRSVINLIKDQDNNFVDLFSKLSDKKIYSFGEVATEKVEIHEKPIEEFKL
ncbi:toll/interleukin-1 receptor domain-containing protein [Clostridium butyricum]|uniref:toll/interleukin-1 receptor domain-containing protein n=1 Tax=Clostridium butyricum TaxID=1492 RepID=UPI0013CFBF15|nr:toll/interleukin-1 receptor domain-containing protein [Clostridium butyricum]MCQ2016672.1 toll/interleukin-1 receptor domain-containing protein [Clostridium butyricum]MCQ2023014.1 toll/interleukin-1 receptor domain-containing protein [Clostridium butyricum]NFB69671.1 hypothetical protein [Clostridium butyricum]NFB92818.1 hypothetical protein [Clostridium butyricum]UTY54257.1 toll/interleukin-1 receptor domain-containing protein [Clostridium butyricum]